MMHGLERPYEFTGLDAQRNHRIGMLVVARSFAAPKVRRRRGRGQEHEPARLVDRHRCPDIGVAGLDAVALERLEGPARLTATRIECAHHAARRIDAAVVADRGADHDDAASDRRRRGDLEFAGPFQPHADLELDLATLTETGTGNAGPRIERNQADVVRAHEDARPASGIRGRVVIDPVRDTAADIAIGRTLIGRDLRIEAPFLRAGAGIERDHLVEGRAEDQAVLDEQRRCLEFGSPHHFGRARNEIAGVIFEGANELADIVGRDLSQGREARAAGIAAPAFPGGAGGHRKQQERNERRRNSQAGPQTPASPYFGFLAGSLGRAPPHGSYFSFGSGMRSSAAL
uniref:Type III effector NopBD n=1 Tax=Bradyrhizobium japonicum TaxID=375 RepID=M4PSN5_BRAJP|nr:type III effector NopBD [Bradyrhizobium japonicum]